MSDILQYWPEDKFQPRDVQVQALEWIAAQSAKYLILQAPVASGKSHIAMTASNFFGGNGAGNSFILTPQKVLQKQYKDTFEEGLAFALYGKSNYECSMKNCSCDVGSLIKPKCRDCPYTNAVQDALSSPNIIMNYSLAFLMLSFHPTFAKVKRKLMVIDECHGLEEALVGFTAREIQRKFVENELGVAWPTDVTNFAQLQLWMEDSGYFNRLVAQLEVLEGQVDQIQKQSGKMSKEDIKTIRRLFRLEEMVQEANEILTIPVQDLTAKFVFDYNSDAFQIRSLYGRDEFMEVLDDKAEKFLFMSGTVDAEGFCNDLGIPRDQCAFLSLDSPIPAAQRPVVFLPTIRMNYQWMDQANRQNRKNATETIKQIIRTGHANDSGVIHTSNFKVAEWLTDQLQTFADKEGITIVNHNPGDEGETKSRDDAIAEYLSIAGSGKRAILISPSCTEGLDLKNELGRFSIVLKVPYGNLGDKWIKRRMELSKEWYARQALNQTLQAAGRVVRDPADSGSTYILDESWLYLMKSTTKLIPQWWKSAYQA